jgi:hypothetical protein
MLRQPPDGKCDAIPVGTPLGTGDAGGKESSERKAAAPPEAGRRGDFTPPRPAVCFSA